MPLIKRENIHSELVWGLWEIDNSAVLEGELLPSESPFEKITHPTKLKEYYGSRLLLQKLCELEQLPILTPNKDQYGKPYLPGVNVEISLSHCFPFAAVAMSKSGGCGIDIEEISNRPIRVASKFLNPTELQWVENNNEKATLIWTAKEAVYKYYGQKKLSLKDDIEVELHTKDSHGITMARFKVNGQIHTVNLVSHILEQHIISIVY